LLIEGVKKVCSYRKRIFRNCLESCIKTDGNRNPWVSAKPPV